MFEIFSFLFFIVFIGVFGIIIASFVREGKRCHKNNQSPRLTVEATVIAKRTNYTRHSSGEHHTAHTTSTYFATFQVASGDRMELQLPGQEYGLIIEGDFGDLTFQGTRFLSFSRKVKTYEEV